ncbi:hypothetical protein VTN49DRAFT_7777 [Thermomyces lanuginosus]|uniref:uncharacterized protein n=1 Tax=Thermomyces lanuginosus TaxID=5541 RepID=UPI003744365B
MMFRSALVRSLRASAPRAIRVPVSRPITTPRAVRPAQFVPGFQSMTARFYSAPAGLSKEEVEGRIINLLKNFDKVNDASKIGPTSHFTNDLGLDSLDVVEVVMAVEEEFSIEIPDKEADAIHSVDQAVNYILSQPDAH